MKGVITVILAIMMVLSVSSFAYAEEKVTISGAKGSSYVENNGSVSMNIQINNQTGKSLQLVSIQPNGGYLTSVSFPTDKDSSRATIPFGSSILNITANTGGSGETPGTLTFYFYYVDDGGESHPETATYSGFTVAEHIEPSTTPTSSASPQATASPEKKEDSEFRIKTTNIDSYGQLVPTPSGDYGETIGVRLPLTCTKGMVYDIKVSPVLSTDIEKFPFDIDLVDYNLSYPNSLYAGAVVEFNYTWRLSKKATVGVKQVDFNVTYRNEDGDLKTGTVSLFVNVRKGLSASTDKDATASVPKLIIESYKLSSDKIYAGETFNLEFTVKNTSSETGLQNIQIHIKDAAETATIVPASGGSNTLYISKIAKGESSAQKVALQTAPDAAAKAYTLSVDFSYESADTNAAHTANETIAVPILQKIRLKCDEPTVYDEVSYIDSSTSMSVKMYNMGRSSVYNCAVDVEGEGLKLEESYFGGTLTAGSTLAADISVIPSVAGDISGNIVISYEDVYGEPGEEKLPFTLHVEDPNAGMEEDIVSVVEPEPEPSKGLPWWGWALGAGALGGGGFFGWKKLKKRRERSLEDEV